MKMYWGNPIWLLLLGLVPGLMALFLYEARRRVAAAAHFAEPRSRARLFPRETTRGRRLQRAMLLIGLACLVVALARPRWGASVESAESRGLDLFVLLDVSRSMLAEDVRPNRLEHAKTDLRDLLEALRGDRVGLVTFAGAPVVTVPLTTDYGFFLASLEEVDTRSAPRGGSLIGDAIRKGLEALGSRTNRDQVLLLITDGEDHESFPLEAARIAAERQVKIFTVGLGDPVQGERIPVRDQDGRVTFLHEEGEEVRSKLDENLLLGIARTTGGAYVPARTRAYDLGRIYTEQLAGLTRGRILSNRRERFADRFQIFLAIGFTLLLVEPLLTLRSKGNENLVSVP